MIDFSEDSAELCFEDPRMNDQRNFKRRDFEPRRLEQSPVN